MKKILIFLFILVSVAIGGYFLSTKYHHLVYDKEIGQVLDSLDGVKVYYNGSVGHVLERNVAEDGYNLGLKYQCVEFVKRYYYEKYRHKMPDSYGHAKDFFDASLADGAINKQRNLLQFTNGSSAKPQIGDLLVFDGSTWNKYGHVAIVSQVFDHEIEIIQQNPGPNGSSRGRIPLELTENNYNLKNERILGWLRMKENK